MIQHLLGKRPETTMHHCRSGNRFLCGSMVAAALLLGLLVLPGTAGAVGEDVTPPTISTLSVSPNNVNVTSGSQTVTATATITDPAAPGGESSGFASGYVTFRSPLAGQAATGFFQHQTGDPADQHRATITIPQFAEGSAAGVTWKPSVSLSDRTGNTKLFSSTELQALGINADLTVQSVPDTEAPKITALSVSPSAVTVSGGAQTVTVTATITDNLSGVGNFSSFISFASPGFSQAQGGSFQRQTGDPADQFKATVTIPQYARRGTWTVSSVQLSDRVGNTSFLNRSQLQAQTPPLDATIEVTSDPHDITAPQLDSISAEPACVDPPAPGACVDATSQDQQVTVKATITDPAAPGDASSGASGASLGYSSPSGIQHASGFLQRTTGDEFQGTVTIRQFAEAGPWRPSLTVFDRAGNNRFISDQTQLADARIGVSKIVSCVTVNPGGPPCESGANPTPTDPVVSSLTIPPGGTGGQVDLRITPRTTDAPGFYVLDQQLDIEAPTQPDTSHPLKIVFKIDTSVLNPSDPQVQLPPGCTPGSSPTVCPFTVFKNGTQVNSCTAVPPTAIAPDPCVVDPQEQQGNTRIITVYSTSASSWNFGVSLEENGRPDCSSVKATPNLFWPPNHKLNVVKLSGGSDPDGDPLTLTVTGVSQDEPTGGGPDAQATSRPNKVMLRAERSGNGNGRVYRIAYELSDGTDSCTGTTKVSVPHSRNKNAVDSGGTFNSFAP
jgi:hypothetical protein